MNKFLKSFTIIMILPLITAIYAIFIKDYTMAFNALLTIFTMFLVYIVNKKINLFSFKSYLISEIFIIFAIYLGSTLGAYTKIPDWDFYLHLASGLILYVISGDIFDKYGIKNNNLKRLFSLFFAISCAGLWEIYEFSCDNLIGTNAQNASLTDTMFDIIAGTTGAFTGFFIKL